MHRHTRPATHPPTHCTHSFKRGREGQNKPGSKEAREREREREQESIHCQEFSVPHPLVVMTAALPASPVSASVCACVDACWCGVVWCGVLRQAGTSPPSLKRVHLMSRHVAGWLAGRPALHPFAHT